MKPTRQRLCAAVSLTLLLLGTGVGYAQEPPPGPAGQGQRAGRQGQGANAPILSPAELERWFDSYVLLQVQDALRLTDDQFARLLPPLKALQAARRRNVQARRQLLVALGGLLKATPVDEAALQERLKALRELEAKSADEIRRAHDALDAVLDTTQQARFRLFEEQVERRKIDLLLRARQRAGEQAQPPRGR